jgi:hypothetical protein
MCPTSLLPLRQTPNSALGIHDWILQSCWWQAQDVPRSDLAPARFDSYYLFYRFTSAALYHTSCCTLVRALTYFVLVVSNQGKEILPASKIETNNTSNKLEQVVVSDKAKEPVAVSKIEKNSFEPSSGTHNSFKN